MFRCERSSAEIAQQLIEDARDQDSGYAFPRYLRVGVASPACRNGHVERWSTNENGSPTDGCQTGVPRPAANGCPDPAAAEFCALRALKRAGVKLGIAINVCRQDADAKTCRRDAREVAWHACAINKADRRNLFDWIFLDFAWQQKRELQKIVNLIKSGRHDRYETGKWRRCIQGGERLRWHRIMTNDRLTPYWRRNGFTKRVWVHANSISLLRSASEDSDRDGDITDEPWYERAIAASTRGDDGWNAPALAPEDRRFVRRVYAADPRSYPMLKLEMPGQTSKLSQLPPENQCVLVARWSRAQISNPARPHWMIYPLFAHGLARNPDDPWDDALPYDSLVQRFEFPAAAEPDSYRWQRSRMAAFGESGGVPPCAVPASL